MLRRFPKQANGFSSGFVFSRSLLRALTDIIYRQGYVLLQRINFSKRIWILILCHRAKSLSPDFLAVEIALSVVLGATQQRDQTDVVLILAADGAEPTPCASF